MEHVNNNLSLCLAAIAGKVDPNAVKYHNGLEYQLLKIAGMTEESSGGDDTPSENMYTAKRVTTKWTVTSDSESLVKTATAYMVTADLGVNEMPYEQSMISVIINDDEENYFQGRVLSNSMVMMLLPFDGDPITFSQDDVDDAFYMYHQHGDYVNYIRGFFIGGGENENPGGGEDENLRLQMFIYPAEDGTEKEMTIDFTIEEYIG